MSRKGISYTVWLKKLNVSPTLYCNVLPLTVYLVGMLMYWKPWLYTAIPPLIWYLNKYSKWMARDIFRVPSWSDPAPASILQGWGVFSSPWPSVHGIGTNPGNREWGWGRPPLSFFVVCDNPIHRVMVNWDPPISRVIHLPGGIQNWIIYHVNANF